MIFPFRLGFSQHCHPYGTESPLTAARERSYDEILVTEKLNAGVLGPQVKFAKPAMVIINITIFFGYDINITIWLNIMISYDIKYHEYITIFEK